MTKAEFRELNLTHYNNSNDTTTEEISKTSNLETEDKKATGANILLCDVI